MVVAHMDLDMYQQHFEVYSISDIWYYSSMEVGPYYRPLGGGHPPKGTPNLWKLPSAILIRISSKPALYQPQTPF